MYSQFLYNSGTQVRKRQLFFFFFLNKCVWNNIGINLKQKVKLGLCLLMYTEINWKQIIR